MIMVDEIQLGGDKSISHRVLIVASLISGESKIKNISSGGDVRSTIKCLKKCNINIKQKKNNTTVAGGKLVAPKTALNCSNSGTTARMLIGLLAGQDISAKLIGDRSLTKRPMKRIIMPLINSGAVVISNNNKLPIEIKRGIQKPIIYNSKTKSSQVISSLIFAGMNKDIFSKILFNNEARDHTELFLQYMNFNFQYKNKFILIKKTKSVKKFDISIPGDMSNASFIIVASLLIPGSKIKFSNLLYNKKRNGFLNAVIKMGAKVTISNIKPFYSEHSCDVLSEYSPNLKSLKINKKNIIPLIDEIPILSILATQASGKTIINDAGELRLKESDRLFAISHNLANMGANILEGEDNLIINGGDRLHDATIIHYDDHRIAMAFVILKLFITGKIDKSHQKIINVSFPNFYNILNQLLL